MRLASLYTFMFVVKELLLEGLVYGCQRVASTVSLTLDKRYIAVSRNNRKKGGPLSVLERAL